MQDEGLASEAKLRLRLPSSTATPTPAAAAGQDGSDESRKAAQQVILRATSLLVESIFTSFGECIITAETLDTVLQACAARENNGAFSANTPDLAAYKAAVLEGYEAAKKIAPRNHVLYELLEKKMELEQFCRSVRRRILSTTPP